VIALDDVANRLEKALPPDSVRRDVPSGELTTYRVGGPLAVLVRLADDTSPARLAEELRTADVPVLVIGRGSNLLVADAGFRGVAVTLGERFQAVEIASDRSSVRAGGGAALPVLARQAAREGVTGLEFYVGIPGSVGGAVRMNAGGHGRETREVLVEATVLDLRTGAVTLAAATDLDFGYRHSNVGAAALVLSAGFRGAPDDRAACEARIDEIVRWRREHQPGGANAGSVFSNPPGDSAGRLIDDAGLKGLRVGGASVSTKHANFIQADAGATAADVHALVHEVRKRVADATGVVLEPEVRLIGFGGTDGAA
jgi:UDP-N-acetylmuramate dehydrogenase